MIDNVFTENARVSFQSGASQDMPECARLSGWRASDLREAGGINPNTLFAAYRDGQTYGQAYCDISSGIKTDSIGLMQVGTMAYMDAWQYSLSSHTHVGQYTYMSAAPTYGPGEGVQVATLFVGEKGVERPETSSVQVLSVYCPVVRPRVKEPAYGTLRFMYVASADVD